MSANENQTPDLASILKTLANLNSQKQQQLQQRQSQEATQDPQPLPFSAPLVQEPPAIQQPQHIWQQQALYHIPTLVNVRLIDPATIIDWSSGLKCVMRTVAKHENMLDDIRRMVKLQHEHELQWWKGRQELIERQKARKENQKKLDDVLKLVGGAVTEGTSNSSPEEMAKELETFDMKVYKAQMQMIREFTAKLKSLGVPFFGTKSELVRVPGKDSEASGPHGPKDEKGMIDEAELLKLQKKMLAILEDLCS